MAASLSRPPSLRFDERLPIALAPQDGPDRPERPRSRDPDSAPELDMRSKPPAVEPGPPRLPPPPQHPIPSMQAAFAESLVEAMATATQKPKLRTGDAKARREDLLDQDKEDPPQGALWRFRPGQQCHELRRLMAQISFGVYLLLNGMANSQVSVFSILQGHIDEVDEFLETTLEDIGLATKDLEDRTAHLKLPMDNADVFERMLEDRNFRLQILEGNLKIEHIVARTQAALEQTVRDLAEAVHSTREFAAYLADQENGRWRKERPDVIDIFAAMKGNTDGWSIAFVDLQSKATYLETIIAQLSAMILEIERKAERVSRRARVVSIQPQSPPKHSHRTSDAFSVATPPDSPARIPSSPPPPRLPNTPPRISLRLSSITKMQSEPLFSFDLTLDEEEALPPDDRPPPIQPGSLRDQKSTVEVEEHPAPPLSPPARNPRRISAQPPLRPKIEEEQKEEETKGDIKEESKDEIKENTKEEMEEEVKDEESDLYILQPRTYTPQPPSPLPSPRVLDEPPILKPEPKPLRTESPARLSQLPSQTLKPAMPRTLRVDSPTRFSQASTQTMEPSKPRVVQQQLRAQVSKPKLVAIAPKSNTSSSPKRNPPPIPTHPAHNSLQQQQQQQHPEPRTMNPRQDLEPETSAAQPRQRTSLRQRVSLKTTPPEPIQVPSPDAHLGRRQPTTHQPPTTTTTTTTFQPPDSAYGSDVERAPASSSNSSNNNNNTNNNNNNSSSIPLSLLDFPIPTPRPNLVPSPRSDQQQFFRPVQASPYSPLQQRPHTAGTTSNSHYHHNHHHHNHHHHNLPPRNIPSAMSNVTTMTSNSSIRTTTTTNNNTLKKKRSAFGWLKKAFSLDDEERAAFEERRRQTTTNGAYHDQQPSPQMFLDGRRIQPPRPGSRGVTPTPSLRSMQQPPPSSSSQYGGYSQQGQQYQYQGGF